MGFVLLVDKGGGLEYLDPNLFRTGVDLDGRRRRETASEIPERFKHHR